MKIKVKISDEKALSMLETMGRNSRNITPALASIRSLLLASVDENFEAEGRPVKWKDLSEYTIDNRTANGKWPGKILQVSGQLASSVTGILTNDSVIIGSNKSYAKLQNNGGVTKTPAGNRVKVPARPFILIQKEDEKEARKILNDHLLRGIK